MIYILTDFDGYFGQGQATWRSLSSKKLSKCLSNKGYESQVITPNEILSCKFISNDIIFYSSRHDDATRKYIQDILYFIKDKAVLLPHYDHLLAYENKGFQSIYRNIKSIGNLKESYACQIDNLTLKLPAVIKEIEGAGSSSVFLCSTINELKSLKRKIHRIPLRKKLLIALKRILHGKELYLEYKKHYKGNKGVIYQQYIPNLANDFKILIYGEKYYVLKRYVRDGDFRASGSGKISHVDEVADGLLDYAKNIFDILNVPFVSLDIAYSGSEYHLIEYQCMNFGPTTLLKSSFYMTRSNNEWKKEKLPSAPEIEFSMVEGIHYWIEKNKIDCTN